MRVLDKSHKLRSSRLARRLVIYVVLASTLITVFTSAFQLLEIYKSDVSGIELRLSEIRDSYADNLASRVWIANQDELELTLQGILRLPDIEHIQVYENNTLVAEVGQSPRADTIVSEYPLTHEFKQEVLTIGRVKITASLEGVYQHILEQALAIVVSNGIKTFLISGFVLLLFYHLVVKHLHTVASYAEETSIRTLDRELKLDRKEHSEDKYDEFDLLVKAFHTMQDNLQESVEELSSNEERLQAVMDNSPAVITIRDIHGHFLMVNHEFEKRFQVSSEEAVGKSPNELFPKEVAEDMLQNDQDVLHFGQPLQAEERFPHDEGMHIYHSNKFLLNDSHHQAYAICSISIDVTDQVRQAEILKRTQKMEALGKLTGGIAHDFNNLLNIIIGYAEILGRNLDADSSNIHFAKEIGAAGRRGASLTRKLLSFTGQASGESVEININGVLQDDANVLKKTLTARINVVMDMQKSLWPVYIDKDELEDAILNLSINAMHAMPEGGQLVYSTSNETLSRADADSLGLESEGDYVRLSIKDSGIGIDSETMQKVFDPFFTTKGDKGTGLGLSQVYGFMQRNYGTINVQSEVGKGSEFSLYFPRYRKQAAEEELCEQREDNNGASYLGDEHILLVDDEPSLLTLAENILADKGYKVYCAKNADAALDILSQNDIDIMVSDVIMPGMDGFELARRVESQHPDVKIQLLSGYASERDTAEKDNPYSKTMLDKPYNAEVLLQRVRSLLDSSL